MNQKNGKNSLGLDIIFEDIDNPIELFKKWFSNSNFQVISHKIDVTNTQQSMQNRIINKLVNMPLVFLQRHKTYIDNRFIITPTPPMQHDNRPLNKKSKYSPSMI